MKQTWITSPLWLTLALLLCCTATAWLALHGFYISLCLSILLTLGVAYAIYRYILRSARAMAQFIWAVRYSEFLSSPIQGCESRRSLPPELLTEMQEALEHYRRNLQKKESRLQYFQALANHIDISILVYTPDGTMEWMNEAAKRFFNSDTDNIVLKAPKRIDDLLPVHPELPEKLYKLKAGDLSVLQIIRKDEHIQLALSGMEFTIQGRQLIIASMKNIHSALDHQETESWQKLIRVLTHEIMNSITPVISLTELLSKQIEQLKGDEETKAEIHQMLQTISRRGNGLVHFVSNYQEVSHLPAPLLKTHTAQDLLQDTLQFMQSDRNDLQLSLPPASLRIVADKEQIEQLLINLIKNARENEAKHITLSAGITSTDHPYLRVTDDGTGIEPDVLERIFIPFFTTKPSGSGIGLTISRQIMHQHNGTITVSSQLGVGSTFMLLFPSI